MIQYIDEQIANIRKAMNETETPVRRHTNKNALTELNNAIVLAEVRDSEDYYNELVNEKGNDD